MPHTIAIVEDEYDQRKNYCNAIEKKGYDVIEFTDRRSALEGLEHRKPDLAVLDIILGDDEDGGFDLCADLLSRFPKLPIIFLTERINENDKINGLRLGAWDYLPKPISLDYLVARISSLLRIHEARLGPDQDPSQTKTVGKLTIDNESLLVSWGGRQLNLSGTEFRMLARLVSTAGSAVSYDHLKQATMHNVVTTNTINTHMRNIRKKFESVDASFAAIKSEYGFGYRWSNG
ncbi:MAG: response regulator [Gammaproteobacteria bacterium]|nr:response regulator [Gammaproteobacteria bacterium]